MQKRIMILGASRYYARSIETAKEAGYWVFAVDKNPDSPGFHVANDYAVCDIIDTTELIKLCTKHKIEAVIPLNDYGVISAAAISEKLGMIGISQEAALLATNKAAMRNKWQQSGVPCPKLFVAKTPEEIIAAATEIGFPCILKPAHGIGGASRGVIVVNEPSELENAIAFCHNFYNDKTTLVESFINSEIEHSIELLIINGTPKVIAVADKIKTPLPYRVDKNVLYPSRVSPQQRNILEETAIQAVISLGITTGAAHVELATTANGPILFELGARCGGGGTPSTIVPFSTGVNIFAELTRILAGDSISNITPLYNKGCNYHFFTPAPGKIASINGFDKIQEHPNILDAEIFVVERSTIPPVTVGTERSGFMIIGASDAEESLNIGNELESLLEIEYENL